MGYFVRVRKTMSGLQCSEAARYTTSHKTFQALVQLRGLAARNASMETPVSSERLLALSRQPPIGPREPSRTRHFNTPAKIPRNSQSLANKLRCNSTQPPVLWELHVDVSASPPTNLVIRSRYDPRVLVVELHRPNVVQMPEESEKAAPQLVVPNLQPDTVGNPIRRSNTGGQGS